MKTRQRIKKDKIAKIIRTDANITNKYCDGNGHYCILGGLLRFAGVSDAALIRLSNGVDDIPKVHQDTLRDVYGLELSEADRLMAINDRYPETHQRRLVLLAELDSIVRQRGEVEAQ